jgi:hypothetical protein
MSWFHHEDIKGHEGTIKGKDFKDLRTLVVTHFGHYKFLQA